MTIIEILATDVADRKVTLLSATYRLRKLSNMHFHRAFILLKKQVDNIRQAGVSTSDTDQEVLK